VQRLLPFCGGMLRSGPSPRAAQQDWESLRGLAVRAAPAAKGAGARGTACPAVGAEPCVGRGTGSPPSASTAARLPQRVGSQASPLPGARLYLGWSLFKHREGGRMCKQAGFPMGPVSDSGSKRGQKSSSTCRLYGLGRGLC